jgi:hypothetical protein
MERLNIAIMNMHRANRMYSGFHLLYADKDGFPILLNSDKKWRDVCGFIISITRWNCGWIVTFRRQGGF